MPRLRARVMSQASGVPRSVLYALGLPPDLEEDVLHDLLGLAALAEDPERERVDESGVEIVEAREGVAVAPRDLAEEPDRGARRGRAHASGVAEVLAFRQGRRERRRARPTRGNPSVPRS